MKNQEINQVEVQEVYDTFNGIGKAWDLLLIKGFLVVGLIAVTMIF